MLWIERFVLATCASGSHCLPSQRIVCPSNVDAYTSFALAPHTLRSWRYWSPA
jgi:hypothetical protein